MIQDGVVYSSLLPKSRMMIFGVCLTVLAGTLGMLLDEPLYTALLSGLLGAAMGYSASRYRKSEICIQVPGIFRAQAIASLQMMACVCLIFFLPTIGKGSSFLFGVGSCSLAIAIGLCIGAGDLILVWVVTVSLFAGAGLFYKPANSSESPWPEWPLLIFEVIGVVAVLAAAAFLFRYWSLLNSSREIVARAGRAMPNRKRADVEQKFDAKAAESQLPQSRLFRIKRLIEFKQEYRIQEYIWMGLFYSGGLCLLLVSRGYDTSVMFFQFIASLMIVVAPTLVFFPRIQQTFERLWLLGSSKTRLETVRNKLFVTCWNCFLLLLLVAAAMVVHSPANLLAYVTVFAILFLAHGFGALFLLTTSRMYKVLVKHRNAVVILGCVLVLTFTFCMLILTDGKTEFAQSLVLSFGMVNSLLVSLSFAVACWCICLIDGGRGMASYESLMELEWA